MLPNAKTISQQVPHRPPKTLPLDPSRPIAPPAKWTRGELLQAQRECWTDVVDEIVGDLLGKGPHAVDWEDDREACEECARVGEHHPDCESRGVTDDEASALRDEIAGEDFDEERSDAR